ncbi:uncharacterized protein DMAD_11162 [Drosophila madeirensis]|uniref:Uncharacterized protein n=1 Tax=Drosophila madeirensis TaxID=30013 RepID=A0AAU9FCE1_DROMD
MAMRLNDAQKAMVPCPLPTQQRQQQQQPALAVSFPVTYPFMDAQQLQRYYLAQMQQPQPQLGANMFVQPWYICQQPQCQSYGYCYGMQMPPNGLVPQTYSAPPTTASLQSAGTLANSTANRRATGQIRSIPKVQIQTPESHSRTPAGGRTYNQCNMPLPETACGWCGSLNSFETDARAKFGASSINPASREQQQHQQQPKQLIKDPERDSLKDFPDHPHREELSSNSKREQTVDTENHSGIDSKKEQRKDLDKQQEPCSRNHHKKDLKPKKLRAGFDSALGSVANSFIKRLGEIMRHTTKRKQPKAKPQAKSTPNITPGSSIVSSESSRQPPHKPSFITRLFGEVRDNEVSFYAQSNHQSRCNIHYPTNRSSDSVEQTEAFQMLRRKQQIAAKGPYKKSTQ